MIIRLLLLVQQMHAYLQVLLVFVISVSEQAPIRLSHSISAGVRSDFVCVTSYLQHYHTRVGASRQNCTELVWGSRVYTPTCHH